MGTGEVGGTRETTRPAVLESLDAVRYDADEVSQGLVEDAHEAFETDPCVVYLMIPDGMCCRAWSGRLPEELAEPKIVPKEMIMRPPIVEGASPPREFGLAREVLRAEIGDLRGTLAGGSSSL